MVPAPPSPLPPFNVRIVPAGTVLHRLHRPLFEATSFNPCKGGPTRFAPIYNSAGDCVPTLYAASSLECATNESLFHDVPIGAGPKSVASVTAKSYVHSEVKLAADIKLVSLFAPDLHLLGLERSDLIGSSAMHYADTAKWAQAFHANSSDVSGLAWTSKKSDPDLAYVLFEDRLEPSALELLKTRTHADPSLMNDFVRIGTRSGIEIIL